MHEMRVGWQARPSDAHFVVWRWCGPPTGPGVAWSIAVSVVVAPHGPPVSGVAMSSW
jgi:hypothetical protein